MVSWAPEAKPDPKPVKRRRATAAEWKRLRRMKLKGGCRVCKTWGPHMGLHHLVGRDLGGDDVEDNLVPLCGSGTTLCHGLIEHLDRTACQTLRLTLTARELAYVIGRKSEAWLDRRYPLPDGVEDATPIKETETSVGSSFAQSPQRWLGR